MRITAWTKIHIRGFNDWMESLTPAQFEDTAVPSKDKWRAHTCNSVTDSHLLPAMGRGMLWTSQTQVFALLSFSAHLSLPNSWLLLPWWFIASWEGNGNPLQCSCLENPRDGGAWWAAAYGVAQSRTWLKRLSSSSSSFFLKLFCFFSNRGNLSAFVTPIFKETLMNYFLPVFLSLYIPVHSDTYTKVIKLCDFVNGLLK